MIAANEIITSKISFKVLIGDVFKVITVNKIEIFFNTA